MFLRTLFSSAPTNTVQALQRAANPLGHGSNALRCMSTQISTLSNGLRVATDASPIMSRTATVGVWLDAGSAYEHEGNNGVAHFLEHMSFKGTPTRSQEQLNMEVENAGASLNAYTSREQTAYFAHVFKDDVPKAVDWLSDILQNSTMSEEDIEIERGVILREMQEVEAQPEEIIFDHLHSVAFQNNSYGFTILGPAKNVRTLRREDMQDYIRSHYTADRMVLVGAGGVDHEQLVSEAEKRFGNLPKVSEFSHASTTLHNPFTGAMVKVQDDYMPLVHLTIAHESVGWTNPDYFPILVIQSIVGAWDRNAGNGLYNSSRLCELIANEELANYFMQFHTSYHQTGMFGAYAIAPPDKVEDLCCEILQEWLRIANEATPGEVHRAKERLKSSILMGLDGTHAVAEDIGRQILTLGRRMEAKEIFDAIDAITVDQVRDTATRYCVNKEPAVAAIGNTNEFPDMNYIKSWSWQFRS